MGKFLVITVLLNYNGVAVVGSEQEFPAGNSQTLHKIVRMEIHYLAEEIV